MKLYEKLASLVAARNYCASTKTSKWFERHTETAKQLVKEHLQSGGGFDAGTSLDWEKSTKEKLVFNTGFHHLDQNGTYTQWTYHSITVRPSFFGGIALTISGKNHNDIKPYIHDVFHCDLTQEIEE